MATAIFNSQFPTTGQPTGTALVSGDASHIVVQFTGFPEIDTYFGSFTYAADGSLAGGVLTGEQSSYNGVLVLSISDINVAAAPVASHIVSGDAAGALALIFGGNDSIQGGFGADPIPAGPGNDTVIALDGNDTIDGGDGDDDINGNKGQDIVFGGAGNDTVRGGQDNDTVLGGDGDDPHVNGNIGDDIVHGNAGNDTVYGGQGADTLYGDDGNDRLSGDLGNDILYGGAGADRFAIAKGGGFDWVGDFNPGEGDRIELAAGTQYTVTSVSGQVVIDLGNGDELGLAGVAAGSFQTGWIVYS